MDHVAIMRKSWKLIPKILDGSKTIESRWSRRKSAPWGNVKINDFVYFKNSGESVTAKATVSGIKEFADLDSRRADMIIKKFGGAGKIAFNDYDETRMWVKDKKYCTLIYLKNPQKISPFNINKKGFGTGCAWITIGDIRTIILG